MYILGIETTGAYASVALLQQEPDAKDCSNGSDGRGPDISIDVIRGNDRFSHLQNLTPQIKTILERNDIGVKDLDAIAASRGPGSFTGIRIGVATARAMSQVSGVPCIGVSSLEALAMRAAKATDTETDPENTLLCPILDARRSQVYGGGYTIVDQSECQTADRGAVQLGIYPSEVVPAGPYLIEEFLDKVTDHITKIEKIIFLGDGIDTCEEAITAWSKGLQAEIASVAFAPEEIRYQDATTVVLRAAQMLREGRTCEYMGLEPDYMRMAEAERKLRMRQAQETRP